MKARLGCRGVLETRFPVMWLSLTSDRLKVEATNNKESESTLFYLIPTGMREVCIQHISSKNFIAINHNGKLISKAIRSIKIISHIIGYIDVGNWCWRRNMLATILRCCWQFWPFLSPTSSIFSHWRLTSKNCHQNKVNNIHLSPTSM